MNVLYIVGNGSQWNDNELRYSLRSLEKYATDLEMVYIVGHIPDWIDTNAIQFIPINDNYQYPHYNVWHKLLVAYNMLPVGRNDFILSSDDHFMLKPTTLANTPIFYKGDHLPDVTKMGRKDIGSDDYIQTLINTRNVLEAFGMPTKFFEGHANKLIRIESLDFLLSLHFDEFILNTPHGITIGSPIAAATMFLHPDFPCVHRKDIKIQNFDNITDLENRLKDADCFSIGDNAIRCGIGDFLQDKFPNPSRFEKNDILVQKSR